MKIYSKKRLWSGVGLLVLAALLLVTMCIKGFRAKSVALVVVLVAIGLGELGSAMSRQQAIEDREERTAFIESKARSRAFSLTQQICLVLTIALESVRRGQNLSAAARYGHSHGFDSHPVHGVRDCSNNLL